MLLHLTDHTKYRKTGVNMICRYCGNTVDAEATVCPYCNTALVGYNAPISYEGESQYDEAYYEGEAEEEYAPAPRKAKLNAKLLFSAFSVSFRSAPPRASWKTAWPLSPPA